MAEIEGITVEEKMEDLALTGYLLQKSCRMCVERAPKEEVLAELATLGPCESDLALLRTLIDEIDRGG
jgi:hypothetical protein